MNNHVHSQIFMKEDFQVIEGLGGKISLLLQFI